MPFIGPIKRPDKPLNIEWREIFYPSPLSLSLCTATASLISMQAKGQRRGVSVRTSRAGQCDFTATVFPRSPPSLFTSARALFPPLPPVSSPLSHNAIARCVRGRPTHRRGGRGVDSQPKAKARRRRKRYGVGEVVCRAGGCSSGSSRCSALFASFSPFVAFFFFADVLHEPAVRSTHAPSSFPLAPHETPC